MICLFVGFAGGNKMFSLGNEYRKYINVLFITLKEIELFELCEFKMYLFLKSIFVIFVI